VLLLCAVVSTFDPSSPTRKQRREQAVANALRGLLRDHAGEIFPELEKLEDTLPLTISLNWNADGSVEFVPDLHSQLTAQLQDLLRKAWPFRSGHVYDIQASVPESPRSRPPSAEHVFAGYDPLGVPLWSKPAYPEPGDLYADFTPGKLLHGAKKLPGYALLSQLTLGPFDLPPAFQSITGTPQLSLTLQVVEHRDSGAQYALDLNLLTGGLLPDELEALFQEPAFHPLVSGLRKTEAEVFRLSEKAEDAWRDQNSGRMQEELKRVPGIVRGLAERLNCTWLKGKA